MLEIITVYGGHSHDQQTDGCSSLAEADPKLHHTNSAGAPGIKQEIRAKDKEQHYNI